MKRVFAVLALGVLAPVVQGVIGTFVPPRYSPDLGHAVVQDDIAAAASGAARGFEGLGHRFEEVKEGLPELGRDW